MGYFIYIVNSDKVARNCFHCDFFICFCNFLQVNKITSRRPSENDTFKELHQSLEPFNLLLHTQKKLQEALDKDKLAVLKRNQTSTSEKAEFQSLCLPHSGAWLAAPPIPAIGLQLPAKEFQVSVKYRLEIAVFDQETRKVQWKNLVTMQLPVMEG